MEDRGSLPWRFAALDGHTLECFVVVVACRISHIVNWIEGHVTLFCHDIIGWYVGWRSWFVHWSVLFVHLSHEEHHWLLLIACGLFGTVMITQGRVLPFQVPL